jgi:dolichyl-phosphate-mannose-protein mannosyltransferase
MTGLSMDPACMTLKDRKRAWMITAVYLAVAMFWLGAFRSPQTGWVPDKIGDSFVVDFGREVTIDRTMLFGGLGPAWGCFGTLSMEADKDGSFAPFAKIDMGALFRWFFSQEAVVTSRLRITAQEQGQKADGGNSGFWQAEYREMGFFHGKEKISGFVITDVTGAAGVENLFDEQDLVPYRPNVLNSTYFDEVYFPRTALEQLKNWSIIYENTHPPLGKDIMEAGIAIMGMTPFGWRWLGAITGALMLPLMFATAKRLFRDSYWATFCTIFFAADFMHFTQTRIGTVDSYLLIFIMASYYFMLVYLDQKAYEKGFWKSVVPLAWSGLFLGLAGAVKWIGFYAAPGLAVLFFMSRAFEFSDFKNSQKRERASSREKMQRIGKWIDQYLYLTCLICIILFIAVPALVYLLSYLPVPHHDKATPFITWVIQAQKGMYEYHSGVSSPHPYYSNWYEWPLDLRPIFFYDAALLSPPYDEAIASLGNPVVWWSGLVGFFSVLIMLLYQHTAGRKKGREPNRLLWFPVVGYLSQYLPWIFSPRKLTFIYHYFSCTPFLILMAGFLFRFLEKEGIMKRKSINVVLVIAVVFFVAYYPLLSGIPVPRTWLDSLRILPRWQW